MSPFPYSSDNKRYHTWNYHLRQVFGTKVCKVALDSGLTCPNRDGSRGAGGCTYCSPRRSGDFSGIPSLPLSVQFELGKREMAKKWPSARFLPYLQAGSSTYAPAEQLRRLWEPLLSHPDTAGLCIATRADCLPPRCWTIWKKSTASPISSWSWVFRQSMMQRLNTSTAATPMRNSWRAYRRWPGGASASAFTSSTACRVRRRR